MTSIKDETSDRVIKLTRDELMSQHVDELLQRQMNLRGERGLIERKQRWYYRNWFVFMVAGCLAAILAWTILEPYFDDVYYIQGTIEQINFSDRPGENAGIENPEQLSLYAVTGSLKIREDTIFLYSGTETIDMDGKRGKLYPEDLKLHREIGVYADYTEDDEAHFPFAVCIDLNPDPNPPEKAAMNLSRLNSRTTTASFLLFPLVAGFIGLAIGAVDGIICRVFKRALIGGGVGFIIGFIGAFFSSMLGGLLYNPLHDLAMNEFKDAMSISLFGFLIQVAARTFAWAVVGMTAGLGYGISLRSKRLILYGFIGGIIGGLFGGMFFDPIDFLIFGSEQMSAHWSRLIGLAFIGASVGMAIGIVEMLSREAWLRMTEGPLAGKEFIVFKDIMKIGSSPRNELYLFNDPQVKDLHARLLKIGDEYEIETQDALRPVLINNRPIRSTRLHNGDRITIGKTSFIFEKRER